uniref:Mitochondrial thiamine pyrophosphate carrier 1 n=1 Tax=Talaromyces marneffei PM1 TaxID=1077442 RepID=A0A093V5V9_TALMA
MEGIGQDAEGGRMERFHAREWNQLYPNHSILGSAIWKLQFLQKEATPGADLNPIQRLYCGALAGITSVTFTYPLDIVRTRLSIQSASFADLGQRKAGEKLPGGMLALYRGIVPTVAGVAPYVGLNFMVYESVRVYLTPPGEKNPSSARKLLAGAISGAVAQTCTYPFDVLRRRFQINTMTGMGYQYKSIWDAVRVIRRAQPTQTRSISNFRESISSVTFRRAADTNLNANTAHQEPWVCTIYNGYRFGPSPCAQHTPKGAQERERLPSALGEAVPLLGPSYRCQLQQGRPPTPFHVPHKPTSRQLVSHRLQRD